MYLQEHNEPIQDVVWHTPQWCNELLFTFPLLPSSISIASTVSTDVPGDAVTLTSANINDDVID